jgi:hypothetical protein
MSQRFKIAEKIVATVLVIWGAFILYSVIGFLYYFVSVLHLKHNPHWQYSYARTFKNFHISILWPLTAIIGGFLLLFDKKAGWAMALITLLLNIFLFFIPQYQNDKIFTGHPATFWIYEATLFTIWLASLYVLLQKPIRKKYAVANKTYLFVALVTGLVLLDKVVVYSTN